MADAVVRLRVESSEYDQKLSRATQQMQYMEKEVRRTGATFAYADKEEIAFIQSLGSMETKSDSARGKIAEMTKAFTELSLQYNRLTKEEKKSPFGKSMASSLEQLKARIKGSKSELAGVEGKLNGFGDVAKQMAGKLGLPIEQLAKFGPYGAAAAVAIKVATDAFKQNELIMDEWGRETEEAKSIYTGFLNALNTGDFSSFFSNINKIRVSARAAYDALDELGTFNAFNQIQTEKARTNFAEATAKFREGTGSKEDVRAAADALKKELQTRGDKEQKAYLAAIDNLAATRGVDKQLLERVLQGDYGSYEEIKRLVRLSQQGGTRRRGQGGQQSEGAQRIAALSEMLNKLSDEELQRIQGLGAQAQRTATEVEQIDKQVVRIMGADKNNAKPAKVAVEPVLPEGSAAALRKKLSELNKAWDMADSQEARDNLKVQIDEITKQLEEMKGKAEEVEEQLDETFEVGSLKDLQRQLKDAQEKLSGMSPSSKDWSTALQDVQDKQKAVNDLQDKIKGKTEETTDAVAEMSDAWDSFKDGVSAASELVGAMESIKSVGEDLASVFKDEKDGWEKFMTVIKSGITILETVISVQEAINSLSEIGAALKTAEASASTTAATQEVVAEGEVAAASAVTTGVKAGEAAAGAGEAVSGIPVIGPVLAVAAIAAVLAAILAATSKAKSAGGYATGGIIPGNSFSGDNLTANVNSGELILNRAQQDSIAGQLQGNPMGNMRLSTEISGSKLRVVLNNDNRSRGGDRDFYSRIH